MTPDGARLRRDLGERIRAARVGAGFLQPDVAQALSVHQATVSNWETGRRLPGVDDLVRLAGFLGVPAASLLPGDGERAGRGNGPGSLTSRTLSGFQAAPGAVTFGERSGAPESATETRGAS